MRKGRGVWISEKDEKQQIAKVTNELVPEGTDRREKPRKFERDNFKQNMEKYGEGGKGRTDLSGKESYIQFLVEKNLICGETPK